MPADVTQDRRVTDLVQGPNLPALSDGSRLLWALPSPVHERTLRGEQPSMGKRCGLYDDNAFRERKPPHECPSPRARLIFSTVKSVP
jgi:hypothetical protein